MNHDGLVVSKAFSYISFSTFSIIDMPYFIFHANFWDDPSAEKQVKMHQPGCQILRFANFLLQELSAIMCPSPELRKLHSAVLAILIHFLKFSTLYHETPRPNFWNSQKCCRCILCAVGGRFWKATTIIWRCGGSLKRPAWLFHSSAPFPRGQNQTFLYDTCTLLHTGINIQHTGELPGKLVCHGSKLRPPEQRIQWLFRKMIAFSTWRGPTPLDSRWSVFSIVCCW